MSHPLSIEDASAAILAADFSVFLTELVDIGGHRLDLPAHLLAWAALVQAESRFVLRAPRGHGKSTLLLAYAAWCCWRHNRTATGWLLDQDAPLFDIVLFSATDTQALEFMSRFRDLLVVNERLFGGLMPQRSRGARRRVRWSATEVALKNHALIRARTFRSSVRGLHPDLVILDDVLNDENSLTSLQREKSYAWFTGTLMPMHAGQLLVVGTALHRADLLAELGRKMGRGSDADHTPLGLRAETYRALDEATGEALWPERFPASWLEVLRDEDPVSFSREYQNNPLDDAASLFPHALVQRAIDAGSGLVLGMTQPAVDPEVVVMGVDLARSPTGSADYTVAIVVAWNPATGVRRIIDVSRGKGLEFRAQVDLVRNLVARHRVLRAVIENNGFQQWLIDELATDPDTDGRIEGHHTGLMKGDLREGIPRLVNEFQAGRWIIPSGDAHARGVAHLLRTELGAFGIKDGRPVGVGEHDDMVIAAWLAERAIQSLLKQALELPTYEIITAEDLGIEPVRIADWDRWDPRSGR
jgi:hypothetical protein